MSREKIGMNIRSVSWYRGRERYWISWKVCVWSWAAGLAEEIYRRVRFAGRDAAKRWGNTRILLSKHSLHPKVRDVTWQPATTHNWVQWVRSNSEIQDSFPSASFAPYLHFLVSEITRSHTIKCFDTCWQTASPSGTVSCKYFRYLNAHTTLNTSAPWHDQEDASYLHPQRDLICPGKAVFAQMVLVS